MSLQTMSFSRMSTWTTCARKYRYQYVERIKTKPSSAMIFGISGHSMQEYANKAQIKRGRRPRIRTLKEKFDDELKGNIKKTGVNYGREDSKRKLQIDALKAVEDYEESIGHTLNPVAAEEKFEIKFSNVDWRLNGIVDLIQENSIDDYKYSGRRPNPSDPKIQAQTLIYRYAVTLKRKKYRRKRLNIHLIRRGLIKNGAEIIRIVPTMTEAQVLGNVAETARAIVTAEKSGDYPMVLNQTICGWCSYRDLCGL